MIGSFLLFLGHARKAPRPEQLGIAWIVLVCVWYFTVAIVVFNGYFRALIGHPVGDGFHRGRVHEVLWKWHVGDHLGRDRILRRGDRYLARVAGRGGTVYWTRRGRAFHAAWRNALTIGILTMFLGLVMEPFITMQMLTVIGVLCSAAVLVLAIRRKRRKVEARSPAKIKITPYARNKAAVRLVEPTIIYNRAGAIVEEKPKLTNGVPVQVMATLLSRTLDCAPAEAATLITLTQDKGTLRLPDHFAARSKEKEEIEDIVRAQTNGTLAFIWTTDTMPREVSWVPVNTSLPREVFFRDYEAELEALAPGDFGIGLTASRNLYVASHNGDTPWHLRSCGSGTGKSTGFKVKAAQICHRDPTAELYCIDTKQVSFENMHGIPGVHVYDDPQSHMGDIWRVFFILEGIMRERYTALRTRQATLADFNDLWMLCDEGNDLAGMLKTFYIKNIKDTGMPAQPTVWIEAIAPLINLGRQVKIRGEFMFQNMTDRVLGGVSLRDSFGIVGMAGYKKNQWGRIIGSTFQEPKLGPGRICMVKGPDETWVQGFYDDDQYLRDYALANRRPR